MKSQQNRSQRPSQTSLKTNPTIGVVMGRFCPLHKGHRHLIEAAARKCDVLYILIVGHSDEEAFAPLEVRAGWLRDLFGSRTTHIRPIRTDLANSRGDPAIISQWCALIQTAVGDHAIDVFITSEAHTYGDWTAAGLGAKHICVDPNRSTVPISGTIIRRNPLASAEFLDPPVLAYFVRRAAETRQSA